MKEACRMFAYSLSYYETAALIFDPFDDIRMNQAAFHMAMCGEFALKAYLLFHGISPLTTHNHRVLIKQCGEHGLPISKELRMYQDDLYEFEAATRYESDYFVEEKDYMAVQAALGKFLDVLEKHYISEAVRRIREKNLGIPPEMQDLEVIRKYYGELE